MCEFCCVNCPHLCDGIACCVDYREFDLVLIQRRNCTTQPFQEAIRKSESKCVLQGKLCLCVSVLFGARIEGSVMMC